ncbi:early nodulin-like protein 7 [Ziziphus jujuba]|uniref:Early nodulin-like protein 7 n=1 Tax=Ziziphus jujuba TaxID=326968 RepID=A0A6P4AD40_ZIZJJ|nr:early nodulin-like protein 7 [Ziziphus jujuba]
MKGDNMSLWMMMVLVLVLLNEATINAKEFKVGDDLGWQEPDTNDTLVYDQWAASKRFHVGDSLFFEYNKKNDSVLVVEKWDYYHCNTSKPITAFDNGESMVELDRPGPYYFVSGAPDHCMKGQRLLVDVMAPHHPPPSVAVPPDHPHLLPHPDMSPSPAPASSAVSVSVEATLLLLTFVLSIFASFA